MAAAATGAAAAPARHLFEAALLNEWIRISRAFELPLWQCMGSTVQAVCHATSRGACVRDE